MTSIAQSLQGCFFLLGRAGAGKTYGCLEAMAAELERSPRGLPLVLLTPEQSTAQLERRLATWPGLLGGTVRARVFSFHHLAREAFLRGGGAPGRQLGEVGRVMLLRQALRRRQGSLAALGSSCAQPGVAETLSSALLEFQRYGWSRADLEAWLAAATAGPDGQSLTARKVHDLALLWGEYEAALAAGGWEDPACLFESAAAIIRRSPWLDRAQIWVDGFASFTALELTLLEALLEKAERVTFALCLDPRQLEHKRVLGPGLRTRIAAERLFENIEETLDSLKRRIIERGLPEDRIQEIHLPLAGQPTRAAASPPLAHLESRVLGRIHPEHCPAGLWPPEAPAGAPAPAPPIELLEAGDRRAEIEAVARRLVTLCRRDGTTPPVRPLLLWREVAVLARDLAPYEVHVREVFDAFRIPFFLDRPRSVQGHPLARSILSALGVLRSGWSGDAFLHHLKSGLCGLLDEDGGGLLENAIQATDPRGALWIRRVEQHPALQPFFHEAAAPLRQLDENLRLLDAPRALWAYLESIHAAARLEAWIAEARGRGDEETVQIHEQAWEQTVAWLEEFEKIQRALPGGAGAPGAAPPAPAHGRERLQELIELTQAALASTQARLIPPTLNQVTVGSVDRSRTPEVKVLFVIGLSDGEFPRLWQPDALLGDEERDALTRSGRRLGPDSQRKRIQEHFLAYIALTRSSERLVLSRPQVDDEGRVCEPSPYFSLVAQMFPKAAVRAVRRAGEGDVPSLPLRPEEWALRLGLALGRATEGAPEDALAALGGSATLLLHPGLTPIERRALELARARLAPPRPAGLAEPLALAFWQEGATLPVTALEAYGECPFKFFVSRMLRLGQRQEALLNAADLGTLRHEILDRLFHALRAPAGLDWGQVDPDRAAAHIDDEILRLRQDEQWRARLEASALGGLTLDEVGAELKLFTRALVLVGRRCKFIQVASEWNFGRGGELALQAGPRRFLIRGTVDRIDAVAAAPGRPGISLLFDYKSGQRRLSLPRMMEGVDLQLLTYALAWRRAGGGDGAPPNRITPQHRVGGVFYWPLSAPVKDAIPGDDLDGDAVDARWFQNQKPSGVFAADLADLLDCEVAAETSSLAFSFRKTKAGALHGASTSHWPPEALAALLDYEERILERWVGMIAQGRIAAQPCCAGKTLACGTCDYAGICRKADPLPLALRPIPRISRSEAIERLLPQ